MGWGGTFLSPWRWSWKTRCSLSSRGLRWWLPCGGGGWLRRLLWKGWSWIWMRLGLMLRWLGCLVLLVRMLRLLKGRWLCLWKGPLCGLGILPLKVGCGWFALGCRWICSSRRCFLGEGSELCLPLIVFLRVSAGISPRRASYFLLLRQKKVTKEKATPLSVSLRFATGNLRCSEKAGVRRTRSTSLRSDSCGPYPAFSCAPRHSQRGLGSTRRGASLCGVLGCVGPGSFTKAEQREGRLGLGGRAQRRPEPPLWLRRGAQRFADKGSQLFERSEFCETPRNASTAGCP
ncbi:hypothetical protein SAMN05443579_111267 [Variovorax sp. PDC80]|nr:hypothetical protein SAMN05443579_111267 [Variovorax sp. PDC80]